jgi:hypothetical protein
MSSASLPLLFLARPDDDNRGVLPPPPLRARETVLNDPGCLRDILAFVPDSFRLVAPVSQTFRRQYLAAHDNSTRTLLQHATATPRTAQFWLDDGRRIRLLVLMAARWGRLDVLRWLRDGIWTFIPHRDGHDICVAAASNGHVHVLEWALTNQGLAMWNHAMSDAATRNGHLHVLLFAQARGYPMSGRELHLSAENGHLNVVIWLREQGIPWDSLICAAAASGGQLHVLQWLRANGCRWGADTCIEAAGGGHLHILQWARANECPWDAITCREAARGGHLHILQWVRANGCPWHDATCTAAAENDNLYILQWVRAHGCPWNKSTCWAAAACGSLDILQWARANGCPWDAARCLRIAYLRDHTEIVEWIDGNGEL